MYYLLHYLLLPFFTVSICTAASHDSKPKKSTPAKRSWACLQTINISPALIGGRIVNKTSIQWLSDCSAGEPFNSAFNNFCIFIASAPKVYVTVSSLVHTSLFKGPELRRVIINYYNVDCDRLKRAFAFVALYDHDPLKNKKNHLLMYKPSVCPEGRIETNYTFPYVEFTKKDLTSKCLGFWVAYLEGGRVIHSSCIRTHPTWMNDIRKDIGQMTLNCLLIPGTHNSGLYFKYNQFRDTIFDRYMYTQDESVFNQLVFGNRFLDLRVWHEGAKMWKSKIQIAHDKIHLGLPFLQNILNDVKTFVENTKEIVILDFHRMLSGLFMRRTLSDWQHKEIVELINSTFGSLLIDYTYSDLTLEELWKKDKRVLITYRDELYFPDNKYITFPVYHWWNESQNVADLHKYLVDNACSKRHYCTAAIAVLTPTFWTPLTDISYSRWKSADQINKLADKWFREELSCSNVVLTDYFLGNNVIEIAMEANKNASRCEIPPGDYDPFD